MVTITVQIDELEGRHFMLKMERTVNDPTDVEMKASEAVVELINELMDHEVQAPGSSLDEEEDEEGEDWKEEV